MIYRVNLRDKPTPYYTLYIGRANKWRGLAQSKWANPFVMKNEGMRDWVIEKYVEHILSKEDLLRSLPELDNQILGCWCPPDKTCHGDILISLFNERVLNIK